MIIESCNLIQQKAKPGQSQPKMIVSNATSPGELPPMQKNERYRLISSRELDDQRILQSD